MTRMTPFANCITIVILWIWVTSGAACAELLSGNGEWESHSGAAMRGTWSVALERSGTDLKGTITLTGSLLFSGAEVSGTVEDDQLLLGTVVDGQNEVTFSGALKDERITGTWQCEAINDSGSWTGTMRGATKP